MIFISCDKNTIKKKVHEYEEFIEGRLSVVHGV